MPGGGQDGGGTRYCPNCGQRIWRLSGDKFLKCHRCGWAVSHPVLRWVTHPTWLRYYVHQLRNYPVSTVWSFTKLAAVVAIVLFVLPSVFAPSLVPASVSQPLSSPDIGELAANSSTQATEQPSQRVQEGYNLRQVETRFIHYLNVERSQRGLQNVSRRAILTQMGQNHSRNMAENEYFAHTEPDGDTIEDRYQSRGLLPECRLPIHGSDEYYPGAENIAQARIDTAIRAEWADGGEYYVASEDDLAWFLFQMWMHSEPHREAMLVASADEAGLGLYITETDEVFASLELC